MTIREIIRTARDGSRAGSGGSWRIARELDVVTLIHHSTPMLRWSVDYPAGAEILSIGWGSVSDQGGMNVAFRELGLPYYYSRAGGAEIVELCTCGRPAYPHRVGSCEPAEPEPEWTVEPAPERDGSWAIRRPDGTLGAGRYGSAAAAVRDHNGRQSTLGDCIVPDAIDGTRQLVCHPDPWMDSEPGCLTFPASWAWSA